MRFVAFLVMTAPLALVSIVSESTSQQPPAKGQAAAGGGKSGGSPVDADALAIAMFRDFDKNGDGFLTENEMNSRLLDVRQNYDKNGDGKLDLDEFKVFVRDMIDAQQSGLGDSTSQKTAKAIARADEDILRAAGLSADGDALVEFFRERMQPKANLEELLELARQLGSFNPETRTQAAAKLVARGALAIPALRYVVNDLNNPLAAKEASRCLECLDGKRGTDLTVAAVRRLAALKPAAAAETLLAFLPLAGEQIVVDNIKAALDTVVGRPGPLDGAFVSALRDPLPLRRAVALEILAASGRPEVWPEIRKLLADAQPRIRLRAALALVQQLDELAVAVLIDLLPELTGDDYRAAEKALHQLAGDWSPAPALQRDDDLWRKIHREVWAGWWQSNDGPTLLAAFRRRTMSKEDLSAAQQFIGQLGDKSFAQRERATAELIAQGAKVVDLLRKAAKSADLEHAQRVEMCLQQIAKNEGRDRLPLSAPVLLAIREPAAAAGALLGFLPFTKDRSMREEIVGVVSRLVQAGGAAEVAALNALAEELPERQLVAAEILMATGGPKHIAAIRKLLTSADAQVRLRAAVLLVHAGDRQAVAALIDLIAALPRGQAWEAEEILYRLAGARAPVVPPGDDAAVRKKVGEIWQAWWKKNGDAVNIRAALANIPTGFLNLTVVAELADHGKFDNPFGQPGGKPPLRLPGTAKDRLVGIDRNGQIQWRLENLDIPIDFQLLSGGRVLIAEYASMRVTERNLKGEVVWEVAKLPGAPVSVQRLANGNTFITLYHTQAVGGGGSLLEVDRTGKTVAAFANPAGVATTPVGSAIPASVAAAAKSAQPIIRAGFKMADGQMICLLTSNFVGSGTCIRLDPRGKEINRFALPFLHGSGSIVIIQAPHFVGNIDVTSKSHLVIVQDNNTVAEYDLDGKLLWQISAAGNRATRLPNGNTLVASHAKGIAELDRAGKAVWKYQPPAGYQAIRARQAGEVHHAPRAADPPAVFPPLGSY